MYWGERTPADDWERDVWLTARRLALLHYHMARVLVDRFGEERGRGLVSEVIRAYGQHCGKEVGAEVDRMGRQRTPEESARVPDLPSRGWHVDPPDREAERVIRFCPLAAIWEQLDAADLGRLYCNVDQAKLEGYNPEYTCVHATNVLCGDDYCTIITRKSD